MSARAEAVFVAGRDSYTSFRIPAIVRTNGVLLAFCEGRHDSAADSGHIDIVAKRSVDNGQSWGPLHVVSTASSSTVGNPAPVVTPNGAVILVSVRNHADATEAEILCGAAEPRRVFVQISRDDGESFDAPRDISDSVRRDNWAWYATGPCHGIVLRTGRIVIPANHSVAGGSYGGHCIYSDDDGATWSIGFVAGGANETAVAELPDGRLYFNARNQSGGVNRLDGYSADGGQTLLYQPQPQIETPVVQGSLLQMGDGPLLYAGPTDPDNRRAMGIRTSTDSGETWRTTTVLDEKPAAYSDLVQLEDRTIGLLFETGGASPYETISFCRLRLGDYS
jgi:sialidase-1